MRITCLQENLVKGLSIVSRSVAARPQMPILANVLLETIEGRLKLAATNLEVGVNVFVGAKVEEEGAITIPARVILEFIQSLPNDRVELFSEGTSLKITCGGSEATFVGIPAVEFPPIPVFIGEADLVFEPATFSEMVSEVSFAAAGDDGRPVLGGVLMILTKTESVFVATDGFRLSLKRNPTHSVPTNKDEGDNEERKLILPAKTLVEISRIVGDSGGRKTDDRKRVAEDGKQKTDEMLLAKATKEQNQVIFKHGDSSIVTRIIDGNFPNFEKIIPTSSTTKVEFEREELLASVKRVSVVARDNANIVRLRITPDLFTVMAGTAQVGEAKSTVEAKIEGEESEIAFNLKFLMDLLNNTSYERFVLEMSGPLAPGVFKPVEDNSFLHIIMPVRVQS